MSETLFADQELLERIRKNLETGQIEAAKLYAVAVVGNLPEASGNNRTLLDTRIIGVFDPKVDQRGSQLRNIIETQGLFQDLLTDQTHSPSTTFNSQEGLISITVRRSLLNTPNAT